MKTEKRFSQKGKTIVFYQRDGDQKFSFLVENDPMLTAFLLANCKTKRVAEDKIGYAVKGIFEKLENGLEKTEPFLNGDENPIVTLSQFCQKKWGKNITTEVVSKTGPDHAPVVRVLLTLPSGLQFYAEAGNQKIARQNAAFEALTFLNTNGYE